MRKLCSQAVLMHVHIACYEREASAIKLSLRANRRLRLYITARDSRPSRSSPCRDSKVDLRGLAVRVGCTDSSLAHAGGRLCLPDQNCPNSWPVRPSRRSMNDVQWKTGRGKQRPPRVYIHACTPTKFTQCSPNKRTDTAFTASSASSLTRMADSTFQPFCRNLARWQTHARLISVRSSFSDRGRPEPYLCRNS